ncbi:MAG TPA: hypothetical protein DCZ10_18145 [Pelotomaculum sp.]|nr:hypothetical protein [Pelotomaculum sp.]
MLLKTFELCFLVGAIFSVVSFLLGHLLHFGHHPDGAIDATGHTHIDGNHQGSPIISPFKPVVIMAFLTVFGGMGVIGLNYLGLAAIFAFAAALSTGILASFLMYRFLIVPLYLAQNTSAVSQQELNGVPATVTLDIKNGCFGRITYVVNNNTYTAPAISGDSEEILKGERVVILNIQKNVFKVTKL